LSASWQISLLNQLRPLTRFFYCQQGSGLPRLAEWLRRTVAHSLSGHPELRNVWIDDCFGNARFCCDLAEHMGSQIFFRGAYSGEQLPLLDHLLADDSVFFDIGANQGEFSIYAARLLSRGEVHAFEPVAAIRRRLQNNVSANNFECVRVHAYGLSDSAQSNVPIYVGRELTGDGTSNAGLPTLFDTASASRVVDTIELRVLDECHADDRVDLMKIDVEGAELFALRGARGLISRCRPFIIYESNSATFEAAGYREAEIREELADQQYNFFRIGAGGSLQSQAVDSDPADFANILAVPVEKLAAVTALVTTVDG
jgi:FkbM family methyltransferase